MAAKKAKKVKLLTAKRGPDTTAPTYNSGGVIQQGFRTGGHFQQITGVAGKGVGGGSSEHVDVKPKKKKGK